MTSRHNVVGPTVLVVGTFVAAFVVTLAFSFGGLYVLGLAGALKLTAEQLADWEERFRHATRGTGLCNAARYMDMDCGDLSRTLRNEGSRALDARRIEQLPLADVQRWYWLGCQRFGLPMEARRFLRMAITIIDDTKETA
jgi:hypothetical protein